MNSYSEIAESRAVVALAATTIAAEDSCSGHRRRERGERAQMRKATLTIAAMIYLLAQHPLVLC